MAKNTKKNDFYVYSTISNNQLYGIPVAGRPGSVAKATRQILIKGGANVINGRSLHTPKGVATRVTAEELEFLRADKAFQRHLAAKYLTVSEIKEDADEVAKDMKESDGSAQETPKSIAKKAEEAKAATAAPATSGN